MLLDYEYNKKNKKIIVSYIGDDGKIKLKYYSKQPTKFVITNNNDPDKSGKYTTWDGKSIKEVATNYPNKYSYLYFLDSLPQDEQNEIYKYAEADIYFIDIETEIINEKPNPFLVKGAVLSISIVNKNKILVIGLNDLSDNEIKSIENEINLKYNFSKDKKYIFKYIKFKNEYELLYNFLNVYVPKMAVLTGWNFKNYDWPYIINRAKKLNIDVSVTSFTKKMKLVKIDDEKTYEEPYHRLIIDYMEIFDKWDKSIKIKESITLDFVSEKILGLKKVNYEGDLKHLYENNYKKFILYNAIDSLLVKLIHEKTRTIDILYGISVLSKIPLKSSTSTLLTTEGLLRNKLKDKNIIIINKNENLNEDEEINSFYLYNRKNKNNNEDNNKDDENNSEINKTEESGVKGAWVKKPITGIHNWVVCYDFNSQYPTTMRQFFISPDTYKGELSKNKKYVILNKNKIELEKNDIITENNSVFIKKRCVIQDVIEELAEQRNHYKKIMLETAEEIEYVKKLLKNL